MFEKHFAPSLRTSRLNFSVRLLPQQSATGAFQSDGFQATCLAKVGYILEVLAANLDGEPFIFSDVDVRFYGDPTADLMQLFGDSDILFQDDGPAGACTGFMVMRPTPRVLEYWRKVAEWMRETNQMDQDAANRLLETPFAPAWGLLPERYWTVGRNGVCWKPGDPVAPPADLMVHHANWTVGIENKLALLEAVKNTHGACDVDQNDPSHFTVTIPPLSGEAKARVERYGEAIARQSIDLVMDAHNEAKARISQAVKNIDALRPVVAPAPPKPPAKAMPAAERYPFGATHARRILDEQMEQDAAAKAVPDCLAIVLQFWSGDKDRAMALARLIADIEPCWRDDVYMVFARQSATPMDDDIRKTMAYVGHKFGYVPMEVTVDEKKTYPGIAFDPWASAMQKVSDAYYSGRLPCANALMIEGDACPLSPDWINRIKEAHNHTLQLGKRITGPRMTFGGRQHWHVNGSFVCHCSLWPDRPSLHRCHPKLAWDVFLGEVLLAEAGPSGIIRNEYGCTNISAEVFLSMAKESALLVSVKDYSAIGHATSLLVHRGR
jgi:DNA-directed RNA polymerase subunit F